MSVLVNECPIVLVVDGIISFIQYLFSNPEITPGEFRWNSDDRNTRIFIGAPFTITRDKVGSLPSVTISRGPFMYENRVIDNLKSADPNTFENPEYRDILRGVITIVCEAGAASEVAGLASFIAIELQGNRKPVSANLTFIHRLMWSGISQETPVSEKAEPDRWQCSITFDVSLYVGWITREVGDMTKFNKMGIRGVNDPATWDSIYGQTTIGSPNLVDPSANFGFTPSSIPQLLQGEYTKKWYFILFGDGAKPYRVEEIIDNKTLRLSTLDSDGNYAAFSPTATSANVSYKLYWNVVHIAIELPKK